MDHKHCELKRVGLPCPFEILHLLRAEPRRDDTGDDEGEEEEVRPRTQEAVSRHAVRVAKRVMQEALAEGQAPADRPWARTWRDGRIPPWVLWGAGAAGIAGGMHFNWKQRLGQMVTGDIKRRLGGGSALRFN